MRLARVITPLRILLVLLFAGLLAAEALSVPGQFLHLAAEAPEAGAVPYVLLVATLLGLVALQVVIVCVWRLLSLVRSDLIFSERAFAWVDTIAWALAAGWAVLAAASAYLVTVIYVTPALRDPGVPILLFGVTLVGAVVVLVVVVLRALLRQAAGLRADLAGVI